MTFYDFSAVLDSKPAAIDDQGMTITYGDLSKLAYDFEDVLKPRTLAFLISENTLGCVAAYVTLMNSGVVPLLLDSAIDKNSLLNLIDTYQPDYIIDSSVQLNRFIGYKFVTDIVDVKLFEKSDGIEIELNPELGLLMTTSGSTGSPKLVRQSYGNLKSNGTAISKYLYLTGNERPITSLPMHYTFGLSIINSHIALGATLLVTKQTLLSKEFWHFLNEQEATSLSGVPYSFEILSRIRFENMDLPSLKTLTQAGGKMSNELTLKFLDISEQKNMKFFVMYGQTEATARMSYVPPVDLKGKIGSIGVPIPKGEFFITDVNGDLVNKSEVEGQLNYRGSNVAMGYALNRADLSKGDEWNGTLNTGDLALRDIDGYYYITGRSNRFVKVFGKRVNLDDVQSFVSAQFGECACIGSEDIVKVFITQGFEHKAIKSALSEWTGINSIAFQVIDLETIPRNSSGKIEYRILDSKAGI
jgi:long-chain acyl-CoA synthetase